MRNNYIIKMMNCGIEEVEATDIYNMLLELPFFDFDQHLNHVINLKLGSLESVGKITSEELKPLNNKENGKTKNN